MSTLVRRVIEKGPVDIARALRARIARPVHLYRARKGTEYRDPSDAELARIESDLCGAGIDCEDYRADRDVFAAFKARMAFPTDYHGGAHGGVYEEKLLEHFVAWDLLDLEGSAGRWPYVDVAGASSPWVRILREQGLQAFSIDLAPHAALARLGYYLCGDATASPFETGTVGSASLQCAYEMFAGDADTRLVAELARILKPGGRVVISPLYTHTHACYYQTPEYYGQPIGDRDAKGYVRRHAWGVPASRKYNATSLRERVWEPARLAGLTPRLLVLRNKASFGSGVYLHFILTLDKPRSGTTP